MGFFTICMVVNYSKNTVKKAVCGKSNCDYKSGIVVGMTNFYLRTFFESRVFVYKNSKCLLAKTIMLNLVQHLTKFSKIPNQVRNDENCHKLSCTLSDTKLYFVRYKLVL